MKLHIQTDSQALVALGAVDTALYAVGGRSHKPLDMSKVCQVLAAILPSPERARLWGLALQSLSPHSPSPWIPDPGHFLSCPWSLVPHSASLCLSPALTPSVGWQVLPLSRSCLPAIPALSC